MTHYRMLINKGSSHMIGVTLTIIMNPLALLNASQSVSASLGFNMKNNTFKNIFSVNVRNKVRTRKDYNNT